jgi:hypothetical protein
VRDGAAEGSFSGTRGIDVDELAIERRFGEAIDHRLIDAHPVRVLRLADARPEPRLVVHALPVR